MNKKNKLKTFIERNKKSNGYLLRKTSFNVFYKIIRFVLLFGLCFMILQPLLNKISISFMEEQDLYDSTIVAIPRHFTLSNYQIAAYLMKYWQALANTALISLLVSVLQIISCTLVGYGFARYKFPLKGLWFAAVILVIVVPPTTIQASLFLNFRFFDIFGIIELITGQPGVNLLNSLTPYALMCLGCMGLKSGLYIYMIRQFFRGIPKELEEAAAIDGCSVFKRFFLIVLPLLKPVISTVVIIVTLNVWNEFMTPLLFLQSRENDVILQEVTRNIGQFATDWTALFPMLMLGVAPLMIFYVFMQKYIIAGVAAGAVKG